MGMWSIHAFRFSILIRRWSALSLSRATWPALWYLLFRFAVVCLWTKGDIPMSNHILGCEATPKIGVLPIEVPSPFLITPCCTLHSGCVASPEQNDFTEHRNQPGFAWNPQYVDHASKESSRRHYVDVCYELFQWDSLRQLYLEFRRNHPNSKSIQ